MISQPSETAVLTAQEDFVFFLFLLYFFLILLKQTVTFAKVKGPLVTVQAELNIAGARLKNLSFNFIETYFYIKPVLAEQSTTQLQG